MIPKRDDTQDFNQYNGAKVLLPSGDSMKSDKVKEWKRPYLMALFRGLAIAHPYLMVLLRGLTIT